MFMVWQNVEDEIKSILIQFFILYPDDHHIDLLHLHLHKCQIQFYFQPWYGMSVCTFKSHMISALRLRITSILTVLVYCWLFIPCHAILWWIQIVSASYHVHNLLLHNMICEWPLSCDKTFKLNIYIIYCIYSINS